MSTISTAGARSVRKGEGCGAVHRDGGWVEVSQLRRASPTVTRVQSLTWFMRSRGGFAQPEAPISVASSKPVPLGSPHRTVANVDATSLSASLSLVENPAEPHPQATLRLISCCRVFLLDASQDTDSSHSETHWSMSDDSFNPLSAYTYSFRSLLPAL